MRLTLTPAQLRMLYTLSAAAVEEDGYFRPDGKREEKLLRVLQRRGFAKFYAGRYPRWGITQKGLGACAI